jgi:phosphate transport system substrate-binding protein
VQKNKNSIGYIEYSYAKQNHIAYTQLKNKSGKWVLPSTGTFKAAMSQAKWSASNGFYTVCVNMGGSSSWPIAGATFILVRKSTSNYTTAHAMFKFFDWGYKSGKALSDSASLDYVPIPSKVYKAVESVWHKQVKAGGKAAW